VEEKTRDYWPLQDAKARFSELVNRCAQEGPQTVTKHGKPAVVVIPWNDYRAMTHKKRSLREFLAAAPRTELDVKRSLETEREIFL